MRARLSVWCVLGVLGCGAPHLSDAGVDAGEVAAGGGVGTGGGAAAGGGVATGGGSADAGLVAMGPPPAWCGKPVVTATSCDRAAVEQAVMVVAPGGEVRVPAGTCLWTTPLPIDRELSLVGAGATLTQLVGGGGAGFLKVVGSGTFFHLSGFSFSGSVSGSAVTIEGGFSFLRVDHCRFFGLPDLAVRMGADTWWSHGGDPRALFDHIDFTNAQEQPFLRASGDDTSWSRPDALGSDDVVTIEDSRFTWTKGLPSPTSTPFDGDHGARLVLRHDTLTNAQVQWHDLGSSPQARGVRVVEVYENTFECTLSDCGPGAVALRGGTGVVFGNVIPLGAGGYQTGAVAEVTRSAVGSASPWLSRCDASLERVCSGFVSHCAGGDYRHCGVVGDECDFFGVSCVDACSTDLDCPPGEGCVSLDGQLDSTGWPCRDQTGRGVDDALTNAQASAPFYWWGNGSSVQVATASQPLLRAERDFYEENANFDGTQGVGVGLKAARPVHCTVGVAYWASDEKTLSSCTAPDVWSERFKPFSYPHPLQVSCP